MNNNINDCEALLIELCIKVINLLNKLKEDGLIDEEEYQKNICKKKDFLDHILNHPVNAL